MRRIAVIVLSVIAASATAMADPLPGDHLIVPGVRIGAAELAPADQGALTRNLGAPDRTDRNGNHEVYRYGADGELAIDFDLAADAPFEISTASPLYRTKDGLGVGSSEDAIRAKLGPPLSVSGETLSYDSIRFSFTHGIATRVSIRAH